MPWHLFEYICSKPTDSVLLLLYVPDLCPWQTNAIYGLQTDRLTANHRGVSFCSATLIGFQQQRIAQVDGHHHELLRYGWPTALSHNESKLGCSTSSPATPLFIEFSHKVLHELVPFLCSSFASLLTE